MVQTFKDMLSVGLNEGFKKPKSEFPQGKKSYSSAIKAQKEGEKIATKIADEIKAGGREKCVGVVAVAKLVKSGKFIAVWVRNKSQSVDEIGGAFLDAGHSTTCDEFLEDHEKIGYDDWEVGGNYTVKWQ